MNFKGFVDKGWIKPSEPLSLPDGTPVTFTPAKKSRAAASASRRTEKSKRIHGWATKSLKDLTHEQGTVALKGLDQLAGDWPKGDSIDEFLKSVRKGRN